MTVRQPTPVGWRSKERQHEAKTLSETRGTSPGVTVQRGWVDRSACRYETTPKSAFHGVSRCLIPTAPAGFRHVRRPSPAALRERGQGRPCQRSWKLSDRAK